MNRRDFQLGAVVLAVLLAAMAWAVARQPVRYLDFSLKPARAAAIPALAILPKQAGPFPVVVYLHGSGDDLVRTSGTLREFAAQGLAGVSMEYNQTNRAAFDAQFEALLAWLPHQRWADTNRVAWVGFSLGAQRMLSYVLEHPASAPPVLVRLGGGMVPELTNAPPARLSSNVLLVHGEQDEVFRFSSVEEVRKQLVAAHAQVETRILPGQPHTFGPNRELVLHWVAEECAARLARGSQIARTP